MIGGEPISSGPIAAAPWVAAGGGGGFQSAWTVGPNAILQPAGFSQMRKNVASQKIGAQLVNATDGSAFTGSVTVAVTGDAGTQATGSVGSGACTHEGNGYHTYAPAQAETNYDLIAFTFTGTGAVPATVQVFTTSLNPHDTVRAGLTALPNAAADAAGGLPISDAGGLDLDAKLANTNEVTAARMGALTDWIDGGRLDLILDARASQTSVDDLPTNAELTAALGTGTWATAIPWNASWDAEVQSECADALTAYGASTLTQTQVTGGAYALNSASFAFNSALDFTTTQKAATLARVTLTDTVTTLTGHTPQTGDSFARIGSTGSGLTSLAPSATALSTAVWTAPPTGFLAATFPATVASTTNITAGTITTVTNLTNAPTAGDLTATMKASVNAEVLDVLSTDTFAEPTGAPGATVALSTKIGYVYMALRNKLTITSTAKTFCDDAGNAEWSKTLSDDGTTYQETEGV